MTEGGVVIQVASEPMFISWRRELHSKPELAFEERATAEFIARKLKDAGLEVQRGIGRTGVVGTLRVGAGTRAIGLRADMDALPIQELSELPYRSQHNGVMHACGHDGHMAMLLAAAWYLAKKRNFEGTVHFIFQPAEEGSGGASEMINDGLFERFPVEAVFGMHTYPGIPVGHFAVREGAMMASCDDFTVTLRGHGGHAALPHQVADPVLAAGHLITAVQSIASRNVHPRSGAVVSVTALHAGAAFNVIPDQVELRGTIRTLEESTRDLVERRFREICGQICGAFGVEAAVDYRRLYPVTVNSKAETELAAAVAESVVGPSAVDRNPVPCMGAEDFAFMLQEKPGSYVWLGSGAAEGGCFLHNARFDFNDETLPIGASYWIRLIERLLPKT